MGGFKKKHHLPETIEINRMIRQVVKGRKHKIFEVSKGVVMTSAWYAIYILTFLTYPFNLFIEFYRIIIIIFYRCDPISMRPSTRH